MMNQDITQGGQFALIPAKVLYDDQLPATAKLLYGEIYRLSHANGYCYATNKEFMAICRCSEATISRLISKLEERGHIRIRRQLRFGDRGDIIQRHIFCGLELAKEDPPEGCKGILKNEDTSPQNCVHRPLKNEDTVSSKMRTALINKKNIYNNTPYSPPSEIKQKVIIYASGDRDLEDAIFGLLENRSVANRKPVQTTRALNGILNRLDRLAEGSRARKLLLLENATTRNWLTVYPLRPDETAAIEEPAAIGEEDPWDAVSG